MTEEEIERVRLHQQVSAIREMLFFAAQCPEVVPYSSVIDQMRYMAETILRDIENRPPLDVLRALNGPRLTSPQSGVVATPIVRPGPPPQHKVRAGTAHVKANVFDWIDDIRANVNGQDSEDEIAHEEPPDRKQQEMDFFFGKPGER